MLIYTSTNYKGGSFFDTFRVILFLKRGCDFYDTPSFLCYSE